MLFEVRIARFLHQFFLVLEVRRRVLDEPLQRVLAEGVLPLLLLGLVEVVDQFEKLLVLGIHARMSDAVTLLPLDRFSHGSLQSG